MSKKNRVRVFQILDGYGYCDNCEYTHDVYALAPYIDKWYEVSDEELAELRAYERYYRDNYLVVFDRENPDGTSRTIEDFLNKGREHKRKEEEQIPGCFVVRLSIGGV